MSQQPPQTPSSQLGLIGFALGIASGAVLMAALSAVGIFAVSPLYRFLAAMVIAVVAFVIVGVLGVVSGLSRHRRLERDTAGERAAT